MAKAKILLYDIETAPLLGAAWRTWDTSLVWVVKEWYLLSFAYKWLDEKTTHTVALPDFKRYKKDPENDVEVIKALHKLFDEADVVIAHNGDKFDQKKANARFAYHNLGPASPFRSIDTLKVARKYFSFTSNRLNDLGEYLGLGKKVDTGGYRLWQACMAGDIKAWNKMVKYNIQDVRLLEKIYLELRPWVENHPSRSLMDGRPEACPKCGGGPLIKKGRYFNKVTEIQIWMCRNCGGFPRSRYNPTPDTQVEFVN